MAHMKADDRSASDCSLSIVMPALNEEADIRASLEASVLAAARNTMDYEIIVVDDGSTDRTADIVRECMRTNARIRMIAHDRPRGFGASYDDGRKQARMAYTVMVHADNVFDRETLAYIFSCVGTADVISGYIANPASRNRVRRTVSALYTAALNALTGLGLRYYNGIQVHRTDWLRALELRSAGYGFNAEILVQALRAGFTCREVPYTHHERPGGGATKTFKLKNIRDIFATLAYLSRWARWARGRGGVHVQGRTCLQRNG
jgi:glycosyltransferase involved in cell wall biosynthesis